MDQPGYDAVADLYADTFPATYMSPLERAVVAAFAESVRDGPVEGLVVDVGCGVGHVTADLSSRRLDVVGVDPSREMLRVARDLYPGLCFEQDDAHLASTDLGGRGIAAIIARFSLIHIPPGGIPDVLAGWASRTARVRWSRSRRNPPTKQGRSSSSTTASRRPGGGTRIGSPTRSPSPVSTRCGGRSAVPTPDTTGFPKCISWLVAADRDSPLLRLYTRPDGVDDLEFGIPREEPVDGIFQLAQRG